MLRVTQLWPAAEDVPSSSESDSPLPLPPRALYGLGGYKVWIGNVCINEEGKRLVSDGKDDVVVVHDFSKEDEDSEVI